MAPLFPLQRHKAEPLLSTLPTRTARLWRTATLDVQPRDITVVSTTGTSGTASNGLSGGAIASIVIGSVIGFLLLLWIVRLCLVPSVPLLGNRSPWYRDVDPVTVPARSRSRHHRRRRHRGSHSTSSHRPNVEIVSKPPPVVIHRSRSHQRTTRGSVGFEDRGRRSGRYYETY